MNKEQLLKKADELIAKANELKELAKGNNYILVPDNIQITESVWVLSKWIVNWTQQLYYDDEYNNWIVESYYDSETIKCKLTPCKYEDLKPWDIFYRDWSSTPNFDDLIWYAVKLKEWYQFWSSESCKYDDIEYNYIWKVEQI